MCGIVGYNGMENAENILINGLKNLEYRGYDSSGIALMNNGKIRIIRSEGKLEFLERKLKNIDDTSEIGIGHTRWATHGKPSEANAHPHTSSDNMFCVVHNGIIENFRLIRQELEKKGYTFSSETDTEVIPQLLSYHYRGDVKDAFRKTFASLEGSFAVAVLCKDDKDALYAAKKASPLAVGRGKTGNFVASDAGAIAEYAEDAVFLDDGDFAEIRKNDVKFFDSDFNEKKKSFEKISVTAEDVTKGKYPHFMLKEIYEQPEKLRSLVKSKVKNRKIFLNEIKELSLEIMKAEKICIVACGSAYHAALAGKIAIEEMCRIPVEVDIASEFRYRNPPLGEKTPVIIISQSGETADSIAALRLANSNGSYVIGIVNSLPSTIANESDYVIPTKAGREVAVATTKGYLTQVAALYMLALHIADLRKTLTDTEIEFYTNELLSVPDKISQMLSDVSGIKKLAKKYKDKNDFFFIGRYTDFAVASEASLKLKEISYINCSAFPAGELKHGTIALIEKDTPVFALCGNKKLFKKTLSNIEEVISRGADVLCICSKDKLDKNKYSVLEIPHCTDLFMPLVEIIPMQLFAYFVADEKGCNIDMPKNLAKSVTVE